MDGSKVRDRLPNPAKCNGRLAVASWVVLSCQVGLNVYFSPTVRVLKSVIHGLWQMQGCIMVCLIRLEPAPSDPQTDGFRNTSKENHSKVTSDVDGTTTQKLWTNFYVNFFSTQNDQRPWIFSLRTVDICS